jgi:Fe-S cluster assembly iron-binding protein IscA
MNTIRLTVLVAAFSLFTSTSEAQSSWDFQFGYYNVFSSNALNYVVQQQNIERTDEGDGITYWNPITNGEEAILTQEITFPRPTAQIYLNVYDLYIANFGGGDYGSGSLWGSIDGTNWVMLLNAPTPSIIALGYSYETNLPSSLIGSSQIWIQIRLETSGWDIMAQFRQDGDTNMAFELNANYVPPPQVNFVKAFTLDYSNLLIGSNYQAQASPDLVTWTNCGAAFTATSSCYTNTNYQRIANWNQLFFRIVQQ